VSGSPLVFPRVMGSVMNQENETESYSNENPGIPEPTSPIVETFFLPFLPISINDLYIPVRYGSRVSMELSQQGRRFKANAMTHIPPVTLDPGAKHMCEISVVDNWLTKAGKFRRKDIQNMEKPLIDAMCEKWGVDDSIFWRKVIDKVHTENEMMFGIDVVILEMEGK
jgi:Holliday junction resolvase RusA-like endonuclease